MALLWLGGMLGYGIGATLAGKYGTSVGYVLLAAAIILASNLLGFSPASGKPPLPRPGKFWPSVPP